MPLIHKLNHIKIIKLRPQNVNIKLQQLVQNGDRPLVDPWIFVRSIL